MQHKRLASVVLGLLAIGAVAQADHDGDHHPPSQTQIDFATATSDLMTNTVFAALVQEIGETTPANAANGKQSISLIFNDQNHDMRLVGDLDDLKRNDYPQDSFEAEALDAALTGAPFTAVQRIDDQWYYRRSIPLSNFVPQCAMCHSNFTALPSTAWVGAVMLRVPIN